MKIAINGKEYGLHWGMGAIRLFCDKTGYEFEKAVEIIAGMGEYPFLERTKAVNTMILCAIQNYANIHELETPDVSFNRVEVYRDETRPEEFQKVMDDFSNSMLNGKTMREIFGFPAENKEDDQKKNKASTKKSSSSTK